MNTSTKICEVCKREFLKPVTTSRKVWAKARFCSRACTAQSQVGKPAPNPFKKGHKPWNKGKPHSEETRKKISLMQTGRFGEQSGNWKGERAKYAAIHMWVKAHKGKATKCEDCGREGQWIHWSNIDHKYRRNLDDYRALCPKCHKAHDLKNNLSKR